MALTAFTSRLGRGQGRLATSKATGGDDHTGDLFRFIACLQEVTNLLLADVDRWPDIFDLERAPEAFVDLILRDLGNPFPFELDAMGKRRLASVLVEMYRQKGTAKGIQNAIRFFLGIDPRIRASWISSSPCRRCTRTTGSWGLSDLGETTDLH